MDDVNIGRLIKKVNNKLTTNLNAYGQKWNLTSMQMSIIDFIANHPQKIVLQHDIEKEFDIKRSTVTVLIQKMEKKDLLIRQEKSTDKRQKQIMLTSKANNISNEISNHLKETEQELINGFTHKQINIIIAFLKKNVREEIDYEERKNNG